MHPPSALSHEPSTPLSNDSLDEELRCTRCRKALEDVSSISCCYLCSRDFCSACIAITSGKFADSPHPSEEQICMNCYGRDSYAINSQVSPRMTSIATVNLPHGLERGDSQRRCSSDGFLLVFEKPAKLRRASRIRAMGRRIVASF